MGFCEQPFRVVNFFNTKSEIFLFVILYFLASAINVIRDHSIPPNKISTEKFIHFFC